MSDTDWCPFCRIVARTEPAEIVYEDDELIVFRNRLRWVPVMLLVVPKEHLSQEELWREMGRGGGGGRLRGGAPGPTVPGGGPPTRPVPGRARLADRLVGEAF